MKFREVLIAVAITVLTIFVAYYGINTFFPGASYDDFCKPDWVNIYVNNSIDCASRGGIWNPTIGAKEVNQPLGYCDFYYQCNQKFDEAMKSRSQKVFFIALPLGIIIVLVGAFAFGLEAVGVGLVGGGIGTLIYGAGAFWPYTQNWLRFLLSLLGLVILIWAVYYFSNRKKTR